MTSPKEVSSEVDTAVRRLLARYAHLVDDGDYAEATELFTDDSRFVMLGTELSGREAVRKALEEQAGTTTVHQVTNIVVSNGSKDGTYHAVADVTVAFKDGNRWNTGFVGRYHDTMTGSGREMRFTQRILTGR